MMLDGFHVRNGFRERLVTKLNKRGYHGKKAGGPACLGGGRDVRCCGGKATPEWQHGNVDFRREGRKTLGTGRRVSGGGGLRSVDGKGPRPMYQDAACGVLTHWWWPFHFRTE